MSMDDRTLAVRQMLRSMCPAASIPYIQGFQLPEEEELVLIECDARGWTYRPCLPGDGLAQTPGRID